MIEFLKRFEMIDMGMLIYPQGFKFFPKLMVLQSHK